MYVSVATLYMWWLKLLLEIKYLISTDDIVYNSSVIIRYKAGDAIVDSNQIAGPLLNLTIGAGMSPEPSDVPPVCLVWTSAQTIPVESGKNVLDIQWNLS